MIALIALIAGTQVATSSSGRKALEAAHLSAPPSSYTQLEFPDHTAVPATAAPAATVRLVVKLTNHDTVSHRYAVQRRLTSSTGSPDPVAPVRTVDVAAGRAAWVLVPATMPRRGGRYAVDVLLKGRTESLRAWIDVRAKKGSP